MPGAPSRPIEITPTICAVLGIGIGRRSACRATLRFGAIAALPELFLCFGHSAAQRPGAFVGARAWLSIADIVLRPHHRHPDPPP